MKPIHAALAAVLLCAPVGACGTLSSAPAVADQASTADKALLVAEGSYADMIKVVRHMNRLGQLDPGEKASAADMIRQADTALKLAEAAYKAGDLSAGADRLAAYSVIAARLAAMIGASK